MINPYGGPPKYNPEEIDNSGMEKQPCVYPGQGNILPIHRNSFPFILVDPDSNRQSYSVNIFQTYNN